MSWTPTFCPVDYQTIAIPLQKGEIPCDTRQFVPHFITIAKENKPKSLITNRFLALASENGQKINKCYSIYSHTMTNARPNLFLPLELASNFQFKLTFPRLFLLLSRERWKYSNKHSRNKTFIIKVMEIEWIICVAQRIKSVFTIRFPLWMDIWFFLCCIFNRLDKIITNFFLLQLSDFYWNERS